MRRIIVYVLVLVIVLLVPVERTDVGKLRPVQSVAVFGEDEAVVIVTDTEDKGRGADAIAALEDLKDSTPAVIYLDTAEFLLVGQGMDGAVEQLRDYLKETVELYYYEGVSELESVSKYLEIHGEGPTMKQWQNGLDLPVLDCREKRIKIMQKNVK